MWGLTDGYEPKDLAAGIEAKAVMSDKEKVMRANARKTAEVYEFMNLTKKLIEIIGGC